jgi:hypothetical protein
LSRLINEVLDDVNEKMVERNESYELDRPETVTIKTSKGYRKKALIGGEIFKFAGTYEGKRDGVIVVLNMQDMGHTVVEMPLKLAETTLHGFKDALSQECGDVQHAYKMACNGREAMSDKPLEDHETRSFQDKSKENPMWGSW